jgi:hypothetical protein
LRLSLSRQLDGLFPRRYLTGADRLFDFAQQPADQRPRLDRQRLDQVRTGYEARWPRRARFDGSLFE